MSVLYFLLLVGVLVLIHELGHFTAAKILNMKVLRFSIGYGRALVRRRLGDTEYQIGIFPIGGYCRLMGGEMDSTDPKDSNRSFASRPLWQRLMVVFAGPAANLLLPIAIYFVFFAGQTSLKAPVVGDVLDGAAQRAGIEPGDRLIEINGVTMRYWSDVENIVQGSAGRELHVRFSRNGKVFERYITPLEDTVRQRDGSSRIMGRIGINHAPYVPIIGIIDAKSPAALSGLRTGDLLISIDGKPVRNWTDVERNIGRQARRTSLVYFRGTAVPGAPQINLLSASFADLVPDTKIDEHFKRTVYTGIERAEMFIAQVDASSPAEAAGMRVGDLLTALDGKPVLHWDDLEQRMLAEPEHTFVVSWKRWQDGPIWSEPANDGERDKLVTLSGEITQQQRTELDDYEHRVKKLVFGAHNDVNRGSGAMTPIENRLSYGLSQALERTGETIRTMVTGFFSVLGGDRPSDALGGPLMMFHVTSVSANQGWDSFLLMMALISVNLGLINLLPVPMLDGGHLLVFGIEAFRGKPLTAKGRDRIATVGLIIVGLITILALRNDFMRFFFK
jgi:regulator of sigma E protease